MSQRNRVIILVTSDGVLAPYPFMFCIRLHFTLFVMWIRFSYVIKGLTYYLLTYSTIRAYVRAGYIDDICHVHINSTPVMIGLFNGDICVVSDDELCDDVHVNAERFAVNPMFACRVVVSTERVCI